MISAVFEAGDADGPIERVFEKPAAVGDLVAWLRQFDARL